MMYNKLHINFACYDAKKYRRIDNCAKKLLFPFSSAASPSATPCSASTPSATGRPSPRSSPSCAAPPRGSGSSSTRRRRGSAGTRSPRRWWGSPTGTSNLNIYTADVGDSIVSNFRSGRFPPGKGEDGERMEMYPKIQ